MLMWFWVLLSVKVVVGVVMVEELGVAKCGGDFGCGRGRLWV